MRRLYLHIYFGVIATAVLVTIVAFAIGETFGDVPKSAELKR